MCIRDSSCACGGVRAKELLKVVACALGRVRVSFGVMSWSESPVCVPARSDGFPGREDVISGRCVISICMLPAAAASVSTLIIIAE